MSDDLINRLRDIQGQAGLFASAAADRIKALTAERDDLKAKLAKADKLAGEFKNCLEVLTKEDDYVCCSGHQCGCYGASLHAQAIYYANEAIDDYHKTTGGKDE